MIFDRLENINKYGIDLQFVLDDLKKDNYTKGKFDISDPNLFGIGLEYETKQSSEALWEAHRKYLDIHVILEGEEIINISDLSTMASTKEYEDDYELFEGYKQHSIYLKTGYFLLLFPHEVHQTSIKLNEALHVKKKVYKKLL